MLSTLNDWRLSKKLLAAFGLLGLLLSGLAITGIVSQRRMGEIADQQLVLGVAGTAALGKIDSKLRDMRAIIYSRLTTADAESKAKLEERFTKSKSDLRQAVDDYADIADVDFAREVGRLSKAVDVLIETDARVLASIRNPTDVALAEVQGEGKQAADAADAALDQTSKLAEMTRERSAAAAKEGKAYGANAYYLLLALSFASIGILVLLWRMMDRTFSQPMAELSRATVELAKGGEAMVPSRDRSDELGEIAKAVELFRLAAVTRAEADARAAAELQAVTFALEQSLCALSKGDLTCEVQADFPPAYKALKTNFNATLRSLRNVIASVLESSEALRSGSQEIAQASEDLARRTESNAASLEETSAALTQIDGRIKATAEAATRTVTRADQAIATVSDGRSVADEAVQAMGRVRESAKGIDEVIEGVDKIAFQTRVLAMNAAVEAGRAGDAGRGFAVVADLVSALAMRAEEEAKRARDQLTVTQTDIVTAVKAVQKVDGALAGISKGVGEVHQLLGSMAADNQAQASAITQISAAIGQMDQSTQQNAAMVEQTSAAARNLNGEVQSLADKAATFRIRDSGTKSVARTATRAVASAEYVSPVKPLPVAAVARPNGNTALKVADAGDWNHF